MVPHPSFEAFGLLDVPAALEAVRAHTGRPLFLVGHSGGGLAFLMHLVRQPSARADVRGVVLLGSQATEACATWSGRLFVAFGRLTDLTLGYTPGRALGLGPEDEPGGVLTEWYRWNRSQRWTGRDGLRLPGRAREPLGAGALHRRRGGPVHRASGRLPAPLRRPRRR